MLMNDLRAMREVCWRNRGELPFSQSVKQCPIGIAEMRDAEERWARFAPYLCRVFPETRPENGIVESPLREISGMKAVLERDSGVPIPGRLWLKLDSHLPISGSIKARGGVYEVLKIAEELALASGMLSSSDSYAALDAPEFRALFSEYSIAVGSTGNLGLSIGIMGAKLGFSVTVHMSADAKRWKKELLREKGVRVVEYASDYSEAVRRGRLLAAEDPKCFFVDDENSRTLFLGYSVAAFRLKRQLDKQGIRADAEHPLLVFLPCGVGGGPGGVAFGLKQVFGDAVHFFFAEPTRACCMILGMVTGRHNEICVGDLGIDVRTEADGLAVGRASGFVGRLMEPMISGCYTLTDSRMFRMLAQLAESENILLEPSALAGMYGPVLLGSAPEFREFRDLPGATYLVWATGGSMVPDQELEKYRTIGLSC